MEVNLGGSIPDYYTKQQGINITNDDLITTSFAYQLDKLEFGIIYFDNKIVSSQYLEELAYFYKVEFSISFKGLGLPQGLYNQVYEYL